MKARSKKAKGTKLEKYIADTLVESGLDPNAKRQPLSGAGIDKGDIRTTLPYTIECKNQKTIHLLKWVGQARKEALQANSEPSNWLLVFSNPEKPQCQDNLVVME